MNDKKLFLLDAYALIFRAYYALIKMPRLTRDGFNTSAIFGFVNTLEELLRKEKPSHLAVCFDPPGPTFRNEAFEDYKGEREATPEDIKLSVPVIKEIIKAYGIPVLEVEGFEADDVIGTMARRAEKEGFTTYMMTPDKDFGQLVSPSVLQYKPAYRGQDFELRGEKEICERYGLQRTSQVIDLLALMGDKIDNIPGCPGVGEKTAEKLITQFGDVENLLLNTDQLKGALKKKIEENAEQIRFSKFLATIRTDVPLKEEPDDLKRNTPDRDKLFAIFKELEFKSLASRVEARMNAEEGHSVSAPAPQTAPLADGSLFSEEDFAESPSSPAPVAPPARKELKIATVADSEALDSLGRRLAGASECGLYMVTFGENDMDACWAATAIALGNGDCFYIPSSFAGGKAAVLDLMARPDITKVTPQAKRDMVVASVARGDSRRSLSNFYDTSLAHYVLQPEMRHDPENLASQYIGVELPPAPKMPAAPRGKKKETLYPSDDELLPYSCALADAVLALRSPLEEAVCRTGMKSLLEDVEIPLVDVLADMELTGVCIDVKALDEAADAMRHRLTELEMRIHRMAGTEFNVSSPAKVGEVLFDIMGLEPKPKKTKTGQYSTSEDVLEKVVAKHPIVAAILEYRQLKKLLTTYLTALPAAINPRTGRIHTNYNQTVTATGRISSSSPNLQNIPVRDGEGRDIRRAFIPSPGNIFLSADYSQIELRLVADFAHDETMLEAFREGKDIHAITAAKIYHTSPEEVTADQRRHAKTANFGILYGISAFGLSTRLGIPNKEAKQLIDNYFATFPTIRRYMTESMEFAREHGYVETRMGRRRMLPDINSKNPVVRGYAERNAVNAPIQGSAADIIKVAMVRIAAEMRERGLRSKMIMQVHDELNFDVIPEELPDMQELVSRQMQRAYTGEVTLTAGSGAATNWLDAH
ncbi:MAG: DNA polymerase I [Bacteroidales bacterium]|nr:DNA polymerase I [Bacteroidales bacterium]